MRCAFNVLQETEMGKYFLNVWDNFPTLCCMQKRDSNFLLFDLTGDINLAFKKITAENFRTLISYFERGCNFDVDWRNRVPFETDV